MWPSLPQEVQPGLHCSAYTKRHQYTIIQVRLHCKLENNSFIRPLNKSSKSQADIEDRRSELNVQCFSSPQSKPTRHLKNCPKFMRRHPSGQGRTTGGSLFPQEWHILLTNVEIPFDKIPLLALCMTGHLSPTQSYSMFLGDINLKNRHPK